MPVSPTLSSILAGIQGDAERERVGQRQQGTNVPTNPFFDSFANVRNRLSGRGNRPTGGPSQVNRTSTVEDLGERGIIPQYRSSFPGAFTRNRTGSFGAPGQEFEARGFLQGNTSIDQLNRAIATSTLPASPAAPYQRPDDMTQFFVDITTGTYDPLTFSQDYEFFRKQVEESIPVMVLDEGKLVPNPALTAAQARLQQLVDAHNTQLYGQASEADAQRRGQALQQAHPDLFGGFDPTVLGNTADNVIAQMIAGAQQRLQSTQDANQRLQLEQEIARLEQARQQVAFDRVSAARAPFLQNNLFQELFPGFTSAEQLGGLGQGAFANILQNLFQTRQSRQQRNRFTEARAPFLQNNLFQELFPGFTNAQQLGGLGQSAFGAILQNLFQTRQSRQQRNRFTEALGALPFFQSFSPQQLQGVTPELALFLLQREEQRKFRPQFRSPRGLVTPRLASVE